MASRDSSVSGCTSEQRPAVSAPLVLAIADSMRQHFYGDVALAQATVATCTYQQSLQFVRESRPLVAVLDCGSDVDFGLALARRLKAEDAATPIIFVTEVSSEDIVIEAFRSGIREFLKKPVDIGRLTESIEYLLTIRGTSQERRRPFPLSIAADGTDAERCRPAIPENLQNVVRFIASNLSSDLSLDLLARKAFVSKFHFCKVFKKHFDMSPLKYVTHKRIERARELLMRSDFNVTRTAFEVGFQDASSFAKQFKKVTGFTPLTYRSFSSETEGGKERAGQR